MFKFLIFSSILTLSRISILPYKTKTPFAIISLQLKEVPLACFVTEVCRR